MTKNTLITSALLGTSLAVSAAVDITGNYEGTFTDTSGATYSQDLDLQLVGSSDAATVTVLMEDLTGGSTLTANQVFVETSINTLGLKAGNYKSQNGSGLLQAESAAANQFELSGEYAGVALSAGQVSGQGNVTMDAAANVAGADVYVQNLSNSNRFIRVVADFFGISMEVETQKAAGGRNTAVAASVTSPLTETTSVTTTLVGVKVGDASGVTQDDGILNDISDATKDVVGAVVTVGTAAGSVTGKAIDKNDAMTYVAELESGAMTYGYSKTDDVDGVFSAKIKVTF